MAVTELLLVPLDAFVDVVPFVPQGEIDHPCQFVNRGGDRLCFLLFTFRSFSAIHRNGSSFSWVAPSLAIRIAHNFKRDTWNNGRLNSCGTRGRDRIAGCAGLIDFFDDKPNDLWQVFGARIWSEIIVVI